MTEMLHGRNCQAVARICEVQIFKSILKVVGSDSDGKQGPAVKEFSIMQGRLQSVCTSYCSNK